MTFQCNHKSRVALKVNPYIFFGQELIECQGPPADVGGYYKVDPAKAEAVMRPSKVFNDLIDKY